MGELGCSLPDVYDMTWAEFCIRSHAYQRMNKRELELWRLVAWEVHTVKYLFGKKKPPSLERYWDLTDPRERDAKAQKRREAFTKAQLEYMETVNQKQQNNGH